VSAIIAAGGRGQRLGATTPKQLLTVGDRPILERSVTAFLAHPAIDEVIVALPADLAVMPPDYLRSAGTPLLIVAGGDRRRDSVANAFRRSTEKADIVIVHDAARPFVTAELIQRTIDAAAESGAAIAAVQASDTVKIADRSSSDAADGGGAGASASMPAPLVKETIARQSVFLAQTPQAFRRAILANALALNEDATDEAALVERAGHPVRLVHGDASNIKITTQGDLVIADAIARTQGEGRGLTTSSETERGGEREPSHGEIRVGLGYDLHRLVGGRPLILGGVHIPFERGLQGNSDADAICHAVTDAVLGAAGAGDIGQHFPDTSPEWTGASSLDLLRRAATIVRDCGYAIGNVDVVVIAERPRLVPHVETMRERVAAALDVPQARVSIKGKTNEGIGELGRNEAIAVHAIALLTHTGAGRVR
jgi:2-C-methyl-D-erythritol 4-phosphate cytidylyltransferase/2-C-methyl-D-erythritol 2,4-cyclodiphosphate synthase